jgi:hypothetical protein
MELNQKTKTELEDLSIAKEDELQKCLMLLETASAEKRRIKRDILTQKSLVSEANNKIAKFNESFDVWIEAVEKANFNKERINSELRQIKDCIYKRLRGE